MFAKYGKNKPMMEAEPEYGSRGGKFEKENYGSSVGRFGKLQPDLKEGTSSE